MDPKSAEHLQPAFPHPDYLHAGPEGMTLRDYFAAKALAALIGFPNKDGENCGAKAVPKLAKWAYEYADAMIEAREAC
ncbi:hypothetical protein [Paraburkholderia sediminicola]|uniref:hypothetical protein n=1 Tax=Paraburkholderia sediminicola TaxID=458836 RepID=UPI0038BD04E1